MNGTRSLALVIALAAGLALWIARETGSHAGPTLAEAHAALPGGGGEPALDPDSTGAEAPGRVVLVPRADPGVTSYADPTDAELEELRVLVPAGSIEGLVLRGTTPVGEGWALLRGAQAGGLPRAQWSDWGVLSNTLLARVGASGIFRFDGLTADRYDVLVETPVGGRRVGIELREGAQSWRLLIVLGEATVFGVVYDGEGLPVRDEEVEISPSGPRRGATFLQRVRTDADGRFRFDGLCGGRYWLVADPLEYPSDEPIASVQIELGAGEIQQVDLGTPRAAGLWTGHVLTPSGRLHEKAWSFELFDRETGATRRVRTARDGAFEVRLPHGRYAIRTKTFEAHEVISELQMPSGDVVRNVLLPPTRVYGTVARADGGELPRNLQIWLEGRTDRSLSIPASTRIEGEYAFNGVPPGVYVITTWPLPLDGVGEEGLQVEVAEDALEWRVDLTLGR